MTGDRFLGLVAQNAELKTALDAEREKVRDLEASIKRLTTDPNVAGELMEVYGALAAERALSEERRVMLDEAVNGNPSLLYWTIEQVADWMGRAEDLARLTQTEDETSAE